LIYETFARGNECLGQPRNPDFLLRPGELLEAFAILTVGPSSRAKCLSRGAPSFSASPQSPAHSSGCQKAGDCKNRFPLRCEEVISRKRLASSGRECPSISPVNPGGWIVPSADLAGIEGPVEAPVIGLAVVNLSAVCNELEALNDSGAFSSASGHLYPRIARAKAATAGEKRRPAIDTKET
jgi:hypothetical protein